MQQIIDSIRGLEVGDVQSYNNLAVVPLIGGDSSLDYLVLTDAIKQGFVINETGENPGASDVEQLFVSNNTGKNVLAIAGEYLKPGEQAGKSFQNRTLTRNIYFAEGFKERIPVKCIERGRWHPAPIEVPRETVEEPEEAPKIPMPKPQPVSAFASGGVVSRYAARAANQRETWGSVDCLLAEAGVSSVTSDLSEVYRSREEDFNKFKENFSLLENQVGVVAVVSKGKKKLFLADVFDKHTTFEQYFSSLLDSYILESGLESEEKVEVSEQEAKGFLDSVDSCNFNKIPPISLGEDYEMKREGLFGFSLCYDGTLVYSNLFTPPDETSGRLARETAEAYRRETISTGFGREVF